MRTVQLIATITFPVDVTSYFDDTTEMDQMQAEVFLTGAIEIALPGLPFALDVWEIGRFAEAITPVYPGGPRHEEVARWILYAMRHQPQAMIDQIDEEEEGDQKYPATMFDEEEEEEED